MTVGRIPSVEGGIQPTLLTAKGDLISATAASTVARLAVGSDAQILVADSTASTGLKWATAAAGGKVLQVVQATTSTATTIASTTAVDTTVTATITPTLNTSKILVLVNMIVNSSSTSGQLSTGSLLKRGSTTILDYYPGSQPVTFNSSGGQVYNLTVPISMMFLDSPATTSATTYKVQGINPTVGNTVSSIYQHNSAVSVILLLEIGA